MLAKFWDVGNPVQALAQGQLQGLHLLQFAMHQVQLRVVLEVADPVEQLRLPGVRGEAAEGVYLGFYRDALMEDFYILRTVDNATPQCALSLKTGEDQMAVVAPEVVLEMMDDSPAGAHAAAGDDDRAALDPVDRHRLFHAGCAAQDG